MTVLYFIMFGVNWLCIISSMVIYSTCKFQPKKTH